jgi:hypothetical protein
MPSGKQPTANDQAPSTGIEAETHSSCPVKNTKQSFARVVFIVFIAFIITGYVCGKARSKDYSNPKKAQSILVEYLVRHSAIKVPDWQLDSSPGKQVGAIYLNGGVIEFSCGFTSYLRDLNSGAAVSPVAYEARERTFYERMDRSGQMYPKRKVQLINPRSARRTQEAFESLLMAPSPRADLPAAEQEELETPRKGATVTEVMGALLGGAELYTAISAVSGVTQYWREMGKVSRWKRIRTAAQLIGAGVSGFSIGFYAGYEDSPNCGSPELSDQMKQPELWQSVGFNLSRRYDVRLNRDAVGRLITRIDTLDGQAVSLRGVWLAINSVINSGGDKSLSADSFIISRSVRDILESNTEIDDPLLALPFSGIIANIVAAVVSEQYRESRFFRGLVSRSRESQLWRKTDFDSWEPAEPVFDFPFQEPFR